MSDQFRQWLQALPKVELHLHLEGAIPLPALFSLVEKYGGDPGVRTLEDLRRRLTYADFPAFIEAWIWKNAFLREYEDFTFIARTMAQELSKQNVRYAEVFFSPSRFAEDGLVLQEIALAIRAGLDEIDGIEVRLIPDLVRDLGPATAARTLSQVGEILDQGIVGIGMGGSEHLYPPEPFAEVFERARQMGLRTGAHAGEAAGADSVRATLQVLNVDRIGHGIRAIEDPATMDLLAEQRVPLEVCPLSNVATGVVADIESHPVRKLWDHGVMVTINTDDPGMFHNTLTEELVCLHEVFGFSADEIRRLTLNAIDASWQPESCKTELRTAFVADPAWSAR